MLGGNATSSSLQALEGESASIDGVGKRLMLQGQGVYHSQLNQTLELAGQELWLRAAEQADAALPAAPNSFTVGIVLSSGEVRWRSQVLPRITALRPSEGIGGGQSERARTVLKTFRFPASCFLLPGESSLPITGVQLRVAPGTWPVGFDDLQIVRNGL